MRTPHTEEIYQRAMKEKRDRGDTSCPLCSDRPSIREFNHWKIVENKYPYDLVANISHLLITKSHLYTVPANYELLVIKDLLRNEGYYTVWIENFPKRQTVPGHKHYHLLVN